LPKAVQQRTERQTVAEMLIMAAENRGPIMFAQIAMLRALHADKPQPIKPRSRKKAKAYRIVR